MPIKRLLIVVLTKTFFGLTEEFDETELRNLRFELFTPFGPFNLRKKMVSFLRNEALMGVGPIRSKIKRREGK